MSNEPHFHQPPQPDFRRDLWQGLALTLALHLLQVPFAIYSKGLSPLFIGITQVVYLFPAFLVAMFKQRYGIAVGLLIGAGLTLLLSFAVCAIGTLTTIH
ncbi:MAG: hypothetical protein HOP19_25270 [Acidobacteria bacterium]|nr:hypothetical protein [Acidobacteriota bacterium]